jgi:tRNA threonylcarbamoyladenosine biosynthesis protein TsaB
MTNRIDPAGVARPGQAQAFAAASGKPILAIETGSRSCSVVIARSPAEILAQEFEATDHGHATMLMPMIERVRAEAGCAYGDLDRVAVAVGPGSFTGLRVGLAAALGVGLAAGLPVVGISSFLSVVVGAAREQDGRRIFALLDSRREEPFFAEFGHRLQFMRPPSVVSADALDAILASARPLSLIGDAPAMQRYHGRDDMRLVPASPNATLVAALAVDPERRYDLPPKPVYVRAPDVTMPKTP